MTWKLWLGILIVTLVFASVSSPTTTTTTTVALQRRGETLQQCNMSYCCTRRKSGVRSSSDSYFHHHRWHKGSNLFSDQKQPDYNSSLSGSQGVVGPCDRNPIPGHCLCETSFTNLRFCSFSPGGKPERSEIMGARERGWMAFGAKGTERTGSEERNRCARGVCPPQRGGNFQI